MTSFENPSSLDTRASTKAPTIPAYPANTWRRCSLWACIRDLGLDPATVNLDGGGLAIGHPLGATGARITGKAAALLVRTGGRYALTAQCIGGGQGIATILESL